MNDSDKLRAAVGSLLVQLTEESLCWRSHRRIADVKVALGDWRPEWRDAVHSRMGASATQPPRCRKADNCLKPVGHSDACVVMQECSGIDEAP